MIQPAPEPCPVGLPHPPPPDLPRLGLHRVEGDLLTMQSNPHTMLIEDLRFELKQLTNQMVAHARAGEVLTHRLFGGTPPRCAGERYGAPGKGRYRVPRCGGSIRRATACPLSSVPTGIPVEC